MYKFGQKSVRSAEKFGLKGIHTGSKFAQKAIGPATAIASVVAPELALPLAATAAVGKPLLKGLQRATR